MSRHFRNSKIRIYFWLLIGLLSFNSSFSHAEGFRAAIARRCPAHFAALFTKAELPGTDEILMPVRRWMKENRKRMMDRELSHAVGETVFVVGTEAKIIEVLGKGGEGEVYLVQTPEGLRSLKIFKKPKEMEPQIAELKSDFPIPSPEIFERDPKTGRVLMEYIEGANVDQIAGDWKAMGLTPQEKNAILTAWQRENQRIESLRRSVPGYNVIYSFRTKKFYRVDASQ